MFTVLTNGIPQHQASYNEQLTLQTLFKLWSKLKTFQFASVNPFNNNNYYPN